MYTGDTTSTVSQGNTKSTIQALLRNRERPFAVKSLPTDSAKEKGVLTNFTVSSDLGNISQQLDSDTKSKSLPEYPNNNNNQQENLDYQKDFNYSQKLFHIADGNLYSIFSPIQGRSYGMKPSFLRKQKYTVQECHSRGRKNLRKGLKFHNFLPSESVTSEKDSGYLNTKWKVHSECRLREEHGTKQITISNWSQSVQSPASEPSYSGKTNLQATPSTSETNSPESLLKEEDNTSDDKSSISDPYDFNLSLQQNSPESADISSKINKIRSEIVQNSSTSTLRKDSLSYVLSSLLEKPTCSEKKVDFCDEIDIQNKSYQKHRRKPVQTRRIVPYVKYLSIMEENESLPLDLSSKCLIDNSPNHSGSSGDESQNFVGKNYLDHTNSPMVCDKISHLNYMSSNENLQVPTDKVIVNNSLDGMMPPQITAPVAVLYPVPFNKNVHLGQNGFHSTSVQGPSNSKIGTNVNQNVNNSLVDKSYSLINSPFANTPAFSVQKSFVKEVQSKPRRRNQRSVIKQKLEDTFRQNGFLVKTKQVSDGEATFCKFRQLRKYTRYYLKSLEQHLPDEFHKMWKGFLPPKTVLPPVLGTSESTSETT